MSSSRIPVVFIAYVLKSIGHPPFMFISKLAACCALLFLDRSDEGLFRELSLKWAKRFILDRPRLSNYIAKSPNSSTSAGAELKVLRNESFCDVKKIADHLKRLLNSLAFMYFSFNWSKTTYLIQINREYAYYLRDGVLPLCIEADSMSGFDEVVDSVSILTPHENLFPSVFSQSSSELVVSRKGRLEGRRRSLGSGASETVPRRELSMSSSEYLYRHDSLPPVSPSMKLESFFRFPRGASITTVTQANYEEFMNNREQGRLLVFLAIFCSRCSTARQVLSSIASHSGTPLKVGVVHSVSEPGLSALYNVSWFPTIIYTPPNVTGMECTPKLTPRFLSIEQPIDPSIYAAASPVHNYSEEMQGLFGSSTPQRNFPSVASDTAFQLPNVEANSAFFMDQDEVRGLYRVFPENERLSLRALLGWIESEGTYVPETRQHSSITEKLTSDDLKASLHAAVTLLKRVGTAPGNKRYSSSCKLETEPPLFVFLGGGMAAGKTTALAALSRSPWWEGKEKDCVVVSADEFKISEFRSHGKQDHQRSTKAAEKLLVQAVNQGRNIVLDSTMMWAPFIKDVVKMVRSAHTTLYKPGPGYSAGAKEEVYFEAARKRGVPLQHAYSIFCLGITVEPDIAVPRGIIRHFVSGRGVPVREQLKSFKLFSQNFSLYVSLVDSIVLYNNNIFVDLSNDEIPPRIAIKEEGSEFRILDAAAFGLFQRHQFINVDADSVQTLYKE